jgi:hypothetical protein
MVKRKSIAKRTPLQKQKQTQIVNINLAKAKPRRKAKGKTPKRLIQRPLPVYIRQPEFIPPAFNQPIQTSLIPPTLPPTPRSAFPSQLGSAIGEALVNVPANSLLAGLTIAPRLSTAATTATGSILLSAINASPNIVTGIGSAIRQSFTLPPRERIIIQPPEEEIEVSRVERVNPFQRYADEEVQRLLNRDLGLVPERQREGEDIATDVEEEAVVVAPLARRRQPLAPAPPTPETAFAEPVAEVDEFFDLPEEEEEPPEELPYTAPQIEDLRQQTLLASSLDPSQFPLLGAPYVEPVGPPVVEIDEPLTERPSLLSGGVEPIGFGKPVTQGFFGEVKPPEIEAPKRGRPKGSTNKPKEVPTAPLLSFFPTEANVEPPSIPFQSAQREEESFKYSPPLSELGGVAVRQSKGEPPKSGLERVRPEEEEAKVRPFFGFGN